MKQKSRRPISAFFLLLPQSRLVMVVVVFKVKFLELTRACTLTLGKAHQEEINLCLSKKRGWPKPNFPFCGFTKNKPYLVTSKVAILHQKNYPDWDLNLRPQLILLKVQRNQARLNRKNLTYPFSTSKNLLIS